MSAIYRVTMTCSGVPNAEGAEAADNIAREFAEHRQHYQNVTCTYADGVLTLTAESDFDPDGANLGDEFSDCIAAYVATVFDGGIRLVEASQASGARPS